MKNLSKISFVILSFIFATATAQEPNAEITKQTIVKTYELERDNRTVPYEVTIWNKEIDPIKLKKEDRYKLNQSRIDAQEKVTKVITIDDQYDDAYDNTIQISYLKEADKDFKMMPTDEGFVIMVRGEELRYSVNNKNYDVKSLKDNFFIIERNSDSK
ncbi:hypothetical protein [uncultured Aquimarina sp.]|uniref:hypothetical protein n=1 Tax=uncultured Aquimarina sp. TaxID=575652 RepID=UPI002604953A|nr:hypothetical protein [uncultured Aquimarina sp.]